MYQITQPKIKCSVCNEINNYTDFSIEKFTKTDSIKVCDNLILSSYIKNANDGSCYYTSSWDLGHIYVDRPN